MPYDLSIVKVSEKLLKKGAIDPKRWHAGKHVVACTDSTTYLITSEGDVVKLFDTSRTVFVAGQSQDMIIVQQETGKFELYRMRDETSTKIGSMTGSTLTGAHLAIDHVFVIILDGEVSAMDINAEDPMKKIIDIPFSPETMSAVHSHYLYLWDRYARYSLDLLCGGISALVAKTCYKKPYQDPLETGHDIILVTHDFMVVRGLNELLVYDATGKIIFRQEDIPKVTGIMKIPLYGEGCAFYVGNAVYYAYNGQIYSLEIDSSALRNVIFVNGTLYFYTMEKMNDKLIPIVNTPPQKSSPATKTTVSRSLPNVYVLSNGVLKVLVLDNLTRYPSFTTLMSIPKRGGTDLAKRFPPFLFQVGKTCYAWVLNETQPKPIMSLHTVNISGASKPLMSYYLEAFTDQNQRQGEPKWKSSCSYVAVHLGENIFVINGPTGQINMPKIPVPAPDLELRFLKHYDTGLWIGIGPSEGTGTTQVYNYNMNGPVRHFVPVTIGTQGILPVGVACTRKGTLLLYYATNQTVIMLLPDGEKRSSKLIPPNNIKLLTMSNNLVYMVIKEGNTLALYRVKDDGVMIQFEKLMDLDARLGNIRAVFMGTKKKIIVGDKMYQVMYADQRPIYSSPLNQAFDIYASNTQIDPDERTLLLYNDQYIFPAEDTSNMYHNQYGLKNTVTVSPRQLVTGVTLRTETIGMTELIENSLVSFVI